MKIIRLSAANVKRLKAIEIRPDGEVILLGGKNNQGKSSVIESIEMLLLGKRAQREATVRNGEEKAVIEAELDGDYVIRKEIRPNGSETLSIMDKNGGKYSGGPQGIIDKLYSKVAFDPLQFSREEPVKQIAILKSFVPDFDFEKEERQKKAAYDERTYTNRQLAERKAQFQNLEYRPDVAEESAENWVERVQDLKQREFGVQQWDERIALLKERAVQFEEQMTELKRAIDKLADEIIEAEQKRRELFVSFSKDELDLAIENLNKSFEFQKIQLANEQYKKLEEEILEFQQKSDALSITIEASAKRIAEAVSLAKLPAGLTFSDEGVFFEGLPLSDLNFQTKLRIGAELGFMLHPELKVLLVKDGPYIDEENLAMLGELAARHGGQVWYEKGGEEGATVIIEDGMVKP